MGISNTGPFGLILANTGHEWFARIVLPGHMHGICQN